MSANPCAAALGADLAAVRPTQNRERRAVHRNLGLRVLVAEDNLVNQKVVARALAACGCTCDLAADGQAALEPWSRPPTTSS